MANTSKITWIRIKKVKDLTAQTPCLVQSFCLEKPSDITAVDLLGQLSKTRTGNKFIIVVIDLFTE